MSMVLDADFLKYYDSDLDALYLDLKVNGEWISSGVWKDISYVGHCCQEGGMYVATRHWKEEITEARVRIYPGSGVNDSWGDTSHKPLYDFYFSPRDLRYLAREHRQGIHYHQPSRWVEQSEATRGTFSLNIEV